MQQDKDVFVELLTDPKIIDPAPHQKTNMEEVVRKFEMNLKASNIPLKDQDNIWGVFVKSHSEMIGIGALLTNDEGDWELGYRFRVKHWGQGYGSELARGMLKYCFEELGIEKVTADVDVKNLPSVKILQKIMVPVREFINEEDKCLDRRYAMEKGNWYLHQSYSK